MTTIFEALRHDHDTQRELIERLLDTQGDSEERREAFGQLRSELEAHAAAEERHFYVPLFESDLTQDNARHSVSEHKELDDFVEKLENYDMSAPQWVQTAEELRHRLLHHLDEEEQEVFQLAGKVLTDAQKSDLATSYEEHMHEERAGTSA